GLAAENPNGTGDAGALGADGTRVEGYGVAARARYVTHGGDDGFAGLPGQLALPTYQVGGHGRAAGAVHPKHHTLDLGVLSGCAEGGAHRVRAHDVAAAQW